MKKGDLISKSILMEIKLYDRLQDYKESNSTTLKEILDEAIKDFLDKKILEERKARYNTTLKY